MCGGALRRYLLSRDELPEAPLTAMTPVSLRTDTDQNLGNAVGALTANLATHIADPQARFEATKASMTAGKSLLTGMTPKEIELFTQLTQVPPLMIGMLGLGDRFPPYSTVISNVPGPRERSYWNGASLDGMYPMSAIYHGFALNFTLLSNADQLDFGVIACRESVPSCQRIIDHLEDRHPERPLYPRRPEWRRRALEIQRFFDEEVGAEARRAFFLDFLDDGAYAARCFAAAFGPATRGF